MPIPARPGTQLWRDQPTPDRVAREVDAVAHLELLEDVGPVPVDGLAADDEHSRDLVAGVALGDELDHLELAWRERVQRSRVAGLRAVEEVAHECAHGTGVE